jgi:hypothetical protein
MLYLQQLFSKNFPTDDIVGRADNIPWSRVPYSIILRHNIQFANRHYLDDIFYHAVTKGDFLPEDFDKLISEHYEDKGKDTIITVSGIEVQVRLFPYEFIMYNDSMLQFPIDTSKIRICDESRRKIIGLCTVEELRTKIIYQYQNPKYHFVIGYSNQMTDLPPRVIKRLIYIPKENKI